MEYRYLGMTGIRVSSICLGTMTFGGDTARDSSGRPGQSDEETSKKILNRYVELGGNFIDTADIYPADQPGSFGHSEEIIGKWLKDVSIPRESLILATKCGFGTRRDQFVRSNGGGLTRNHILWSVDQSLQRLRTNYVDLYQIHCWDNATPVEETFKTLNDLVRSGKIRYIGVSNVTGWQLQKICDTVKQLNLETVVTLQTQYSLLSRGIELELTDVCKNEGIGILPWSPLKGGLLTGKFGRDVVAPEGSRAAWIAANPQKKSQACPMPQEFANEKTYKLLDAMKAMSEKRDGATVAQVALRWAVQKPGVASVIIGAKTVEQLDDNMAAARWSLTDEEMALLDELSSPDIPYPYEMIWRCNSSKGKEWVLPTTWH